jgi:ADP-ribose pyrophosphatase YjhB (NUDIX family)
MLEETGLRVRCTRRFEVFQRIMRDARGRAEYHYVLIDYLCKVVGGELRPGDDVARVRWTRRAELSGLKMTEGTLAVIERAYSQVAGGDVQALVARGDVKYVRRTRS